MAVVASARRHRWPSAAAVHGARWVDATAPLEILHSNRNPLPGLRIHSDRLESDEYALIDGVPVTTPARTAVDLGCWHPVNDAVAVIDDLLRATDCKVAECQLLADRYPGRRGMQSARAAIGLADAGAQSPKETWLRLLLIRAGLPRPQTQIPVSEEFGGVTYYLDMGWEDFMVAAEYDGEQHRRDRWQYTWDIRRRETLERLGWIVIQVVAGDRPADIVSRVSAALARRGVTLA
ncbi:hypothetical protein O976_15035 [Mycobacterium avium subsp. paratuberculosis 10-8425]|uniref:DUF559 domain-containing protein n=1 Tax=Mycolicibacterium paratuberculosis (strain ATCC BAA-968 / K-10) TaxID=262316 RepID=Q741D4_MYCPA|nr:hypothetical protein MAP_1157c [Mycobacterium avium subsp. paratuberculosis K-10]AGL37582.1 hypothetical protein MAP4_2696 [Mycobacterium avium subsp. paratuberculosis MAP4]ETB30753.1 hypothetical protein O977_15690 [Mycobacterium avium subsp. paratuberculosis 10-5975]ETB50094.1 hypothetical protein O976_15035 [Mycobacterium avium subsp. paratuberculosis 10-8425]QKU46149.1 hypothetical protein MAP44135_2798 [Mycobacterium avium subsp. paratuberculosis]